MKWLEWANVAHIFLLLCFVESNQTKDTYQNQPIQYTFTMKPKAQVSYTRTPQNTQTYINMFLSYLFNERCGSRFMST